MRLYKRLSLLLLFVAVFPGCSIFEPEDDNHSTLERVYEDPSFAEGLLIRAYTHIPTNDYRWDEVATDDAVTNDPFSSYMRMATGEWSSLYNPQSLWDNCNRAILYINHFLDVVDEVPFKWTDQKFNDLFVRRLKGEAYGLRGMFKYFLLRNHGGVGANGELLGIPEYNEFITTEEDFAKPRETFAESLSSAYADLDEALNLLTTDYGNLDSTDELPAGFEDVDNIDSYNTVFGDFTQQRMSGRHVMAVKARLALLAASPAFNPSNDVTLWENAANYAGALLDAIGGVAGLDPKGHMFYLKAQVDAAELNSGDRTDLAEILWRRPIYTNRSREANNFPPTLYGDGRINPTQNFVDAFPMANGYPIADANSAYDPANPYAGRDPRLALYVVYNGSTLKGQTIESSVNGGDNALNALPNSTRTGYYLKKLLREDVNVNPSSPGDQRHFNTHMRYTELFLSYAEAANEAWGPDAGGTHAYTARDVIAAIRKRAGIAQPDNYLASVTDKDTMRELIRNERRLELSFEGFRFWDLRRWNADLTEPAKGVRIENGTFTYFDVEQRSYDNSYMQYGPLPYSEIIKFDLVQNKGWN
jgi:hypothetical protein